MVVYGCILLNFKLPFKSYTLTFDPLQGDRHKFGIMISELSFTLSLI